MWPSRLTAPKVPGFPRLICDPRRYSTPSGADNEKTGESPFPGGGAGRPLGGGGERREQILGPGGGSPGRKGGAGEGRFGGGGSPAKDAPRGGGDPAVLVADPTRAGQVLNWRPQHSDLDAIIQSAWKWHSSKGPQTK